MGHHRRAERGDEEVGVGGGGAQAAPEDVGPVAGVGVHDDGVEAWTPAGDLAGGLYGVAIGGLFAGESMFHRQPDASKVALVALVDRLRVGSFTLLDVQWATPHLTSLGTREITRRDYLTRVRAAVSTPATF